MVTSLHATEAKQFATVADVLDHQRLVLTDGRVWSLRMVWMPELAEMKDQLIGKKLETETLFINRYGENVGNLYDTDGLWLQESWIADGNAATWPIRTQDEQAELDDSYEFLAEAEQLAREAELGIWSLEHPHNSFQTTTDDLELDPYALRGKFLVVEGEIKEAVARQLDEQTVIYLNFGDDYKSDFTILVAPPVYSEFRHELKKRNLSLKQLSGRSIRARGILGLYNGPSLTLTHHMSIEFLED